jgi:hypothetical protein
MTLTLDAPCTCADCQKNAALDRLDHRLSEAQLRGDGYRVRAALIAETTDELRALGER